MKNYFACMFIALIAPWLVCGQTMVPNAPSAAATSPIVEMSAGYTYFAMDTRTQKRVGLSGLDANGFLDVNPRWGLMADASYARIGDVLGTGHSGNVVSLLAGPAFYPAAYGVNRIFVRTLLGASLVNSAVPVSGTYYLRGTVMRFSYAVGGGVERPICGTLSIRVGGDYVRTTFADSSAAMRFQNNLRLVTGLVYRFGERHP